MEEDDGDCNEESKDGKEDDIADDETKTHNEGTYTPEFYWKISKCFLKMGIN